MRFGGFLKDKVFFLIGQFFISIYVCMVMGLFGIRINLQILVFLSIVVLNIVSLILEYIPKNNYYKELYSLVESLDDKSIAHDIMEEGSFEDARILEEIIREVSKDASQKVSIYENAQNEYRDYIERWIHEIKTPIAAAELLCKNSSDLNDRKILNEIKRIDEYVEQALYYAKSSGLENDYSINKLNLEMVIRNSVKKNARQLISSRCTPVFESLEKYVYGDEKWIEFIIGQIISNSIKYRSDENLKIVFSSKEKNNSVYLYISDNGIGISDYDKRRIFEKGYTGSNIGRSSKSTGMGLYICKTLCEKMNMNITVDSEVGSGSTFCIIFPKDRLTVFE